MFPNKSAFSGRGGFQVVTLKHDLYDDIPLTEEKCINLYCSALLLVYRKNVVEYVSLFHHFYPLGS